VSLHLVHRRIERRFNAVTGWIVVVLSVGLCAIGVVIGRFQRYNSWDLVTQPGAVAATTLDWVRSPLAYVQPTGVALAVGAFFGLAYLTLWSLWPSAGTRVVPANESAPDNRSAPPPPRNLTTSAEPSARSIHATACNKFTHKQS
jgi:hypothetical protein